MSPVAPAMLGRLSWRQASRPCRARRRSGQRGWRPGRPTPEVCFGEEPATVSARPLHLGSGLLRPHDASARQCLQSGGASFRWSRVGLQACLWGMRDARDAPGVIRLAYGGGGIPAWPASQKSRSHGLLSSCSGISRSRLGHLGTGQPQSEDRGRSAAWHNHARPHHWKMLDQATTALVDLIYPLDCGYAVSRESHAGHQVTRRTSDMRRRRQRRPVPRMRPSRPTWGRRPCFKDVVSLGLDGLGPTLCWARREGPSPPISEVTYDVVQKRQSGAHIRRLVGAGTGTFWYLW
ncbi:hypothetical protein B0T11DRAFT_94747 [Plectosphaerella cucumerina]|uniref:Uncharacterized protein n=1 Tax=Plectosphaerella cucumerina TaxID=40658 RepID=A0A8K0TGH6_9PEZI|nr:hypothetical protein B0T11DRAFT_94747 [Plectosphaerella cucumerina]